MTTLEEEFGWVIERGDSSPSSPTYWSGPGYWSQDHMDAVRFARRQDAERVACRVHGGYHRISEHGWRNNPAPPAVEASDDLELAKALRHPDGSVLLKPWQIETIAAEFAAIRREATASPTELEKELTAALREAREELAYQIHKGHRIYSCAHTASLPGHCNCGLDEFRVTQDRIVAVLAKATERGL